MPYILKDWSFVEYGGLGPYQAPELRRKGLAGRIFDRPDFEDGHRVLTSPVVRAEGRRVWTQSGSEYLLEGEPDPGWIKFLTESKIVVDFDDPFGKAVLK